MDLPALSPSSSPLVCPSQEKAMDQCVLTWSPLTLLAKVYRHQKDLHRKWLRKRDDSMKEFERAGKAYFEANYYFLQGGIGILIREESVVVQSMDEVQALLAVIDNCPRPFALNRVVVREGVPDAVGGVDRELEAMKEALRSEGIVLVEGSTYAVLNTKE